MFSAIFEIVEKDSIFNLMLNYLEKRALTNIDPSDSPRDDQEKRSTNFALPPLLLAFLATLHCIDRPLHNPVAAVKTHPDIAKLHDSAMA